jgi:6-phosphogluconolactonase/glucosamine-6-phosphate isomerase/deaminase
MHYVSPASPGLVTDNLVERIGSRIVQNVPTLFLVSGGSTADTAVDVCRKLLERFPNGTNKLKTLFTLSLIDERFGSDGHQDSNWKLLVDRGLETENFRTFPVLTLSNPGPEDFGAAVARFNSFLRGAVLKSARKELYIVTLFGIGSDGHTAGILPGSPASRMETSNDTYATGYQEERFKRITITPSFFPNIDCAVVYAAGPSKQPALNELLHEGPAEQLPARFLKLAKETLIFTDV